MDEERWNPKFSHHLELNRKLSFLLTPRTQKKQEEEKGENSIKG